METTYRQSPDPRVRIGALGKVDLDDERLVAGRRCDESDRAENGAELGMRR
jgi:hypothetical protein